MRTKRAFKFKKSVFHHILSGRWESYFNYFSEYYPEKLWQSRLKWETKINGRSHESFFKNLVGHEIFSSMVPPGLQNIFGKIWKPSSRLLRDLMYTLLYALKVIAVISKLVIFSLSQTQINKVCFQLIDCFFPLPSQTHIAKIYGVLLLSRAPRNSIWGCLKILHL